MRTVWKIGFPPVFTHAPWQGDGGAGLADDVDYFPAKKRREVEAAERVCKRIMKAEVIEAIYNVCDDPSERPPLVVAPAMNLLESQNVLAIGYAQNLAFEMGWDVGEYVFQAKSIKRDFVTDGWFRIVHQPDF